MLLPLGFLQTCEGRSFRRPEPVLGKWLPCAHSFFPRCGCMFPLSPLLGSSIWQWNMHFLRSSYHGGFHETAGSTYLWPEKIWEATEDRDRDRQTDRPKPISRQQDIKTAMLNKEINLGPSLCLSVIEKPFTKYDHSSSAQEATKLECIASIASLQTMGPCSLASQLGQAW